MDLCRSTPRQSSYDRVGLVLRYRMVTMNDLPLLDHEGVLLAVCSGERPALSRSVVSALPECWH